MGTGRGPATLTSRPRRRRSARRRRRAPGRLEHRRIEAAHRRAGPAAPRVAARARCGRGSGPRRGGRSRAGAPAPRAPTPRSGSARPRGPCALTRACRGRSTSTTIPARLRQPSSAVTRSSADAHSTVGLTSARGGASGPAWKTSIRRIDAELRGGEADPQRALHQGDHPLGVPARAPGRTSSPRKRAT